jgi:hypothetical protein
MKKKKNEIEIERIYSVNINHYCAGTDGLYMWQKAGPPKPEISYDVYLMMLSNGLPDVALRTPHRDTQRTPSLLIATPFLRILTARLEKFVVHGQAGRRGRLSWWPLYQTERAMSHIGSSRTWRIV